MPPSTRPLGDKAPRPRKGAGELRDRISAMLGQEPRYLCRDYLGGEGDGKRADAAFRASVCRWMLAAVEGASLQRATAIAAIGYLDRFFCTGSPVAARARRNRREHQLVAMACLYVSAKINDRRELSASAIARMSRGLHSAEDIVSCERVVLASLRWRVQGPTSLQFAGHALELLPEDDSRRAVTMMLRHGVERQAERAAEDYVFVILRRSSIALASVLNCLETVPKELLPSEKRAQFTENLSDAFSVDVNSPLIRSIRRRLIQADLSSLETFRREGRGLDRAQGACTTSVGRGKWEDSPQCVMKN